MPGNPQLGEALFLQSPEEMLATMEQKIQNINVKTTILYKPDVREVHVAISHHDMGKRHKNVRKTILDRTRKNHQLSRYTYYLLLNPRSPGVACTTFVLPPKCDHWEKKPIKMLPDEALVA